MDVRKWILEARSGDRDAFCRVYGLYRERLYRFAYYRLGHAADAEDAVSECVLSAWQQIENLREPEAFSAWIFRILTGCCNKLIRQQIKRREQVSLDAISGGDGGQILTLRTGSGTAIPAGASSGAAVSDDTPSGDVSSAGASSETVSSGFTSSGAASLGAASSGAASSDNTSSSAASSGSAPSGSTSPGAAPSGRSDFPKAGSSIASDPALQTSDQTDLRLVLQEALEQLDEADREIVLLSAVAGLKSAEIGTLTGMPAGTVRSRLSRSLKKVRGYLK